MDVIRVSRTGDAGVLTPQRLDQPEPGPGEVLVRLAAVGVNYIEVYHRTGLYPMPLPFTPGSEGAGTVVAVGAGVTAPAVGDRVAGADFVGAYAGYALAPADRVVPVPDGVDDEVAAAALLQGLTAHYLVFDAYPLRPGDIVLVHAAAGGVGLLLTQLATALGGRVVATASTEDKRRLAADAGAEWTVGYDEFPDRIRELTGAAGVPAVYDSVGQATFDASLASLRRRGTLVLYGQSSGPVPPFDLSRLAAGGSLYVTRPTLGSFVATRDELVTRTDDLFRRIADGSLRITIGGRYPLAEAARAHTDLESRRTTGKLLLIP
ncbi:quinone oxidoreductase [Polymorphospora sp. NPDC050346]|uniref:quinone oxidoreductase family protein n=1 Tax=Polymorphospora sp. NPDC050346 TaxID=3155780 RepID=UPI0033D229ED